MAWAMVTQHAVLAARNLSLKIGEVGGDGSGDDVGIGAEVELGERARRPARPYFCS